MIPTGGFTPTPIVRSFQSPYDRPYNPLSQDVLGGVNISDPSRGRQFKIWNVSYDGTSIAVKPADGPIEFSLPQLDVLSVSLAFDNNMGIVLAWQSTGSANLYYFDTLTSNYIIRNFPNITSCRVCVDDAREFYLASSDVIFGYTLNGNLYYRQQRDRYNIEYLVGATTKKLRQMAPNLGNRLQFQLL